MLMCARFVKKKIHLVCPIYSVDPAYGGHALMYGVAQILLKKCQGAVLPLGIPFSSMVISHENH
jgi:hypothetical protein